jgi:hypothetical protein
MTAFALSVCSDYDETLIRVFNSEERLRAFCAVHGPFADDLEIQAAYDARGLDVPSSFLGYVATYLQDGVPLDTRTFYWVGDGDRFDPFEPLFYRPESVV